MNAEKVKHITFDKGAFGYKIEEVNSCLGDIAKYLDALEKQNDALQNEVSALREKNQELEAAQDGVREVLMSAQKFSSTVVSEAKHKASAMLEEAEQKSSNLLLTAETKSNDALAAAKSKSDSIVEAANQRAAHLISEATAKVNQVNRENETKLLKETAQLKAMQKEVSDFKSHLLSVYKSHLDLITNLPEVEKEPVASPPPAAVPNNKIEQKEDFVEKTVAPPPKAPEKVMTPPRPQPQPNAVPETKTINNKPEPAEKLTEKPVEEPLRKKSSPFKITITNNTNSKDTLEKKELEEVETSKNSFKSRFGELKFGENKK
mgnify:CR=1 FL=1